MNRDEIIQSVLDIAHRNVSDEDKQKQVKDLIALAVVHQKEHFICVGCKREYHVSLQDSPKMCIRCTDIYMDMKDAFNDAQERQD